MKDHFYQLFDLNNDQESPEIIDDNIRASVKVVGTNLWVLIFAILIASVGLNVNSTAVIIGAMLISPLMGPIIGIGYGTGINDFELIKLALRNLAIFTFISILSSTLYFTISPLNTATSEILARTSPNMWDVLIAFFGGAAGIIAITRKSISNVVPGVAIGTALMPPLCTAGYGIAHGNWEYFGGAFFLYCINSVFIAFSTLVFVKLFKLPKLKNLDEITHKRTNVLIGMTVFLMIAPSVYLAYNVVEQNNFISAADDAIMTFSKDPNFIILGQDIDGVKREIVLTISGDNPPANLASSIESKIKAQGIEDTSIIIRRSGNGEVDLTTLKSELKQDVYNNLQNQVDTLSARNAELESAIRVANADKQDIKRLIKELEAQYPELLEINITQGESIRYLSENVNDDNLLANDSADNVLTSASTTSDNSSSRSTEQTAIDQVNQVTAANTTRSNDTETVRLVLLRASQLKKEDELRITQWLTARFNEKVIVKFIS